MTPQQKKKKRRLLWAAALALITLFGLALYAYFVGTRTFLDYAENFAFRRMTVSQLADQGSYRFFYATNRVPGQTGGQIADRFLSEREASLKFGYFDTRIEPSLGLGMIVNPSDWFLNEEIQLLDVREQDQDALLAQLRDQVNASPRRSLLVVIHGFREAFPSALRKTAFLGHVLDINTPVLVVDWPGDQGSSLNGYRRARRVATESGAELAQALKLITQKVEPDRVWLLANSMGGQVVVNAFHQLMQDSEFSDTDTEIENVILTAPDVDHREFNERFKHEIKALADNVTVYVSSNDRALLVSRVINRGLRLGESTLDPTNPGQIEQTANLAKLLEPEDEGLVLVDVTAVNRTRNFHNFSLETPEFFSDLFLRLTGTGLPKSREIYLLQTPNGGRYFVLTRGR